MLNNLVQFNMKDFIAETQYDKFDSPEWQFIEMLVNDLTDTVEGFVVLVNKNDTHDYIQTCVTHENFQHQGRYSIELRKKIMNNHFQYRFITDDLSIIVKDFYQFYYGLPIDMDKYLDVNNE